MIITLYRTGADGRLHYYTIHDRQQVLDAPYALCAAWRVGMGRERERLHRFETLAERDAMIRTLVARRIKEGYRVLYSFNRASFSDPKGSNKATGDAIFGSGTTGGAQSDKIVESGTASG